MAIKGDCGYVTKLLLDNGAKKQDKYGGGKSPLHLAAEFGAYIPLKHLISKGANVNDKDDSLNTPLHCAAQGGHPSCCDALCQAGADLGAVNKDGRKPADVAKDSETRNSLTVVSSKCCLLI